MLFRISLATTMFLATACVVDDELDDLPTGEVTQEGKIPCPPSVCGENSPVIDSFDLHELHELGLPNSEGFRLVGFDNGGAMYSVDVAGGAVYARKQGFPTLSGASLIGPSKAIVVRRGTDTYRLKIENVNTISYLPMGSGSATTYKVTYTKVGSSDQATNVCDSPPWSGENDLMGMAPDQLVFYEGDRISMGYTVSDSADTPGSTAAQWFNFGCAGHVLSKLHLTHHSFASKTPGYSTTRGERQAMLKMYAADYCGIGEAFTLHGTDLGWADNKGWLDYYYDPMFMAFEARWTSGGATCLEKPRLTGTPPEFPAGVDAAITAKCGTKRPPTCSSVGDLDFTNFDGAHLISGSP